MFSGGPRAYDLDRSGTSQPNLAEMTTRAIELLGRNDRGFLLVVEGSRIGDAFDASLARKGLQEARAFDDAIAAAMEKVREVDPDYQHTTIVVTSDHDHTLVMNGNSTLVQRTSATRPGVLGLLRSFNDPTQPLVDASGRPFTTLAFGTGTKRVKGPRSQAPALSDLALGDRNAVYEAAVETPAAIGGTDVMLSAMGANAARFHGTLDNTQVFALLREAMGL
jgi:alkaline phosphatase